jgi:pyruvate/2-oxoglutarate dehydrogenase complex dihydrolipoamide dehydrogenase (E3) component
VSEHQFDLVVVGMGPGGEYVATKAAAAGMSVAAVEQDLVGGECPFWGCNPSKMMIRAANLIAEARRIPGVAGGAVVSPAWAPVARRIREEATHDWDDKEAADRFIGLGGTLFRGHGRLCGQAKVSVGDVVLVAKRGILIDIGTPPWIPPIDGLAATPFWTNRQAIETEAVPTSLVVLGGGPVGVELAQVFARFGARVTVVQSRDRLLAHDEPESGALLETVFEREGISVVTGTATESVSYDGHQFTVGLAGGGAVTGERLLVAAGRRANLASLGVGVIGQDEQARYIDVDDRMQAAPGVWALGDAVGKGAFTHLSLYQGRIVLNQLLGRPFHPVEYHAVPSVTFTDPEIGTVGLREAEARERLGDRVATAVRRLPESPRGWIHDGGNDGFIKLVADTERGVLVGATSAGPAGGEVLGLLSLAVHAPVPIERLRQMIYAYPTFYQAVAEAIGRLH